MAVTDSETSQPPMPKGPFHVIVVGGGHAGSEAAVAAARSGARTCLITLDASAIGRMSCNPSIGGLAKGQIVREVDALGGIMGKVADRSGIHFRLLNASKGPAVQSPRSQNDRGLFAREVQSFVAEAGVVVVAGEVADLQASEQGRVLGVRLATGQQIDAPSVVLTTGTFLGGVLHVGEDQAAGGRLGEGAAHLLADRLRGLNFRMGRMKTGTPPRLYAQSIDWAQTEPQPSDEKPTTFAFSDETLPERRVDCAITRTTPHTHQTIHENVDRSPLFSGRITGSGPRYCPSIEDKVFRFPNKDSHQLFLEPEGLDSDLVYPNGISTSLPKDVQENFVRSIPGLEKAEFAAFGYAVEYDHIDPTECGSDLQTIRLPGLYLAGQINGTTGYEEAAGQGLIAGINAARSALGELPFVLQRHEAYIGVLIDDLVTRGVSEPYRMFTSLAEHRLLLRHHDADVRLFERASELSLLSQSQRQATAKRRARRQEVHALLASRRMGSKTIADSMRSPGFEWPAALKAAPELATLGLDTRDFEEVEISVRYEGYVKRERRHIAQRAQAESYALPRDLDYSAVPHLRAEAREKFARISPQTIGQAGRIPGIGPADISVLMVWLKASGHSLTGTGK